MIELHVERADDVVQARRQSAARHDRGLGVSGPEVELRAGAPFFERGGRAGALAVTLDVDGYPDGVRHVSRDTRL